MLTSHPACLLLLVVDKIMAIVGLDKFSANEVEDLAPPPLPSPGAALQGGKSRFCKPKTRLSQPAEGLGQHEDRTSS